MKPKLSNAQKVQVVARRKQGAPIAQLAAEFGVGVATIDRALRSAKKPAGKRRASPSAPEGDGLEELLTTARKLASEAEAEGNLPGVATMGRLIAALLETKRKAAPPPTPEEQGFVLVPAAQMQEAARQTRERLHQILSTSPEADGPPCAACGRPLAFGVPT